ncbi:MAG: zinc-ribbon domain-containing protein [Desulfobacterales bacterium]|uniref:Zinc-ribbon domain-containing protein n=1 Tax=Candidatus Desulfaltia bathyphila TaxID=2841697 RepID=A0A8J6TBI9_9BACT|nr:zinc-ribbon domain-containing protein [Candidatus Desulfaltia bathyphila]MBL7196133.1 zinc-ribbon domain-containing protein [Desulfobacterales bacterium]MBL7207570.1 zinc-ribbon domain-containing protein [Desulfobacterales bacterium]
MDIVCKQCKSKFKIPDEKVPKGQIFTLSCPKCKNKISIDTRQDVSPSSKEKPQPSTAAEPVTKKTIIDEVDSGTYDASEKPFDFLEEGAQTALLCEPDSAVRSKVRSTLENMGYNVTEPESDRDALKQMRFHVFDLVVLNEVFSSENPDENNVMKYLERLPMATRRKIFVVLATNRFRTTDNMAAFNKSVNIVVNTKNIDEIGKIIKKGLSDNAAFYRVFKDSLVKTGKV